MASRSHIVAWLSLEARANFAPRSPPMRGAFLAQGAALRPQRAPRSFATHASLGSLVQRSPRTARAVQRREADGGARRPAAAD
jgi:hypothetical protein